MTNSSPQPPQPPENEPQRKPVVSFDEMVAIIVAFSTIGAILFWSLGSGSRKGILSTAGFKNSFSGWKNTLLSSTETTEEPDIDLAKAKVDKNIALNGVLSGEVESDTLEQTSKYLDRQPKIKDIENLDSVTAFTRPTQESLGFAAPSKILTQTAPVDRGVTSDKGKIETPDVTKPKTPDVEDRATTPEVEPEAPDVEDRATTPEVEPETPVLAFTDVTPDYWAYPFIENLGNRELISGFSENDLFEPDKLITRASMATLISQAFDQPASQPAKNFTDVPNQNAIAADINKAVETGFMHGYSDKEFRPLENIPRYQVLVTLATGLGLKPSQDASSILGKFNDPDGVPDWAEEQVAAAAEAGLAVNRPGFSSNFLQPNEPATRAEVAAMIHQALVQLKQLKSIDSQYIVKP